MSLNESKGNMYDWVTHTWNTVKGECYHDCSYCYMKRWGKLNTIRFDKKELKTDLRENNIIFLGSSCDMFAQDIPLQWLKETFDHCNTSKTNIYLLQTKNTKRLYELKAKGILPNNYIFCTTIETNRHYPYIMNNCIIPKERARWFNNISDHMLHQYVTIEPIMDFDLKELVDMISFCYPSQVNIGADTGKNNLPEPSKEKILQLVKELELFTNVKLKKNLNRLIK